ncbi:MAG: FHA domain-containing protein [Deferribacteres bacterium]|nr:FHA domain-containing protein [candidate division KSB1 bacterium]MCB9502431.1 FHA domain-containing protein [Deferribacteres bacterium]
MAKLILVNAEGSKKEIALPPQHFHIGRKESNDLVLPDKTVSREHAKLRFDSHLRTWHVENLSKTNPVYHNNKQLGKPSLLFDQDIIEIGVYSLEFTDD